jgi:hypothetical protein
VEVAERIRWSAVGEGIGSTEAEGTIHSTEGGARIPVKAVVRPIPLAGANRSAGFLRGKRASTEWWSIAGLGSRCRLPAAGREVIGLIWRLHMNKALTAAYAITILVALSAQDASAATTAQQPVQASGEATEDVHEANEAVGDLTDDTVITTKVKAALLQDPGTAALAIGVETFIGGVRLTGSVDSVDRKQRAQDIAERVDGVIAVDNALSVK